MHIRMQIQNGDRVRKIKGSDWQGKILALIYKIHEGIA